MHSSSPSLQSYMCSICSYTCRHFAPLPKFMFPQRPASAMDEFIRNFPSERQSRCRESSCRKWCLPKTSVACGVRDCRSLRESSLNIPLCLRDGIFFHQIHSFFKPLEEVVDPLCPLLLIRVHIRRLLLHQRVRILLSPVVDPSTAVDFRAPARILKSCWSWIGRLPICKVKCRLVRTGFRRLLMFLLYPLSKFRHGLIYVFDAAAAMVRCSNCYSLFHKLFCMFSASYCSRRS